MIPAHISWPLARKVSDDVKEQWATQFDWWELNEMQIWTLLECGIPDAVKAECINRWEWSRATLAGIMDFFSQNEVNEVTINVIRRIKWSSYSEKELEHVMANISFQNMLLTAGRLCKYKRAFVAAFHSHSVIVYTSYDRVGRYQHWIETPTLTNLVFRHAHRAKSVAWNPDGTAFSSACITDAVRAWDSNTGRQLYAPEVAPSTLVPWFPDPRIILSPDGLSSACRSHRGIVIRETTSGHTICTLDENATSSSVAFHPNSSTLVSGSIYGILHLWDVASRKALDVLQGHEGEILSVTFSSDGRKIVSGSRDRTIRVWDADFPRHILTLTGHDYGVKFVAITPDGSRIVSACWGTTIRIWDAESGSQLRLITGGMNGLRSISISPDGTNIASGTHNLDLVIWDTESGEELQTLQGHSAWINCVAFSPDGTKLLSGSDDGTVRIWDLKAGKEIYFPPVINTGKAPSRMCLSHSRSTRSRVSDLNRHLRTCTPRVVSR